MDTSWKHKAKPEKVGTIVVCSLQKYLRSTIFLYIIFLSILSPESSCETCQSCESIIKLTLMIRIQWHTLKEYNVYGGMPKLKEKKLVVPVEMLQTPLIHFLQEKCFEKMKLICFFPFYTIYKYVYE